MKPKRQGTVAGGVVLALFALALGAGVGMARASQPSTFVSISPIYQGNADLDQGGGRLRTNGALVRLGTTFDLGGGTQAGAVLTYDYLDFNFENPVAFGGVAPWDKVQRYGLAIPVMFRVADGWVMGATPTVDWFREYGARADALTWGATFSAVRVYADGNRVGLGLGAFYKFEDRSLFPFLVVNWRLSDRWRLVNPLPTGPTGGAGLELAYEFSSALNLGIGAAFREYRFRLDDDGPVPEGIGSERGVPVFLRASYAVHPQVELRAYAGVITGGRLRVEDPAGNLLRQDDLDGAPVLALSLFVRF